VDKALKQRITGAVVLVILGVVFIPVLLDGAGHHARFARNIDIPAEPDIELKTWDELKEIPALDSDRQSTKQASPPVVKKAHKPEIIAWALQVGSFSNETNALVMRDQLRAKGYKAYVETVAQKNGEAFKVRIGPDLDKSRLEKLANQLASKENIKSIIVKHP
jgi:DedD protein